MQFDPNAPHISNLDGFPIYIGVPCYVCYFPDDFMAAACKSKRLLVCDAHAATIAAELTIHRHQKEASPNEP